MTTDNPNPTATISLGKQSWQVKPLTIGQLQDIMPTITTALIYGLSTKDAFDASMKVIKAALGRDYKDVTIEQLYDIEVDSFQQIKDAVRSIALLSGLKRVESGEKATLRETLDAMFTQSKPWDTLGETERDDILDTVIAKVTQDKKAVKDKAPGEAQAEA